MRFADMLREIIHTANRGYASVSREIGRSSGFIGNALSEGKPLRVDTLAALCDTCGFEVVVRGHGVEYAMHPSGTGKDVDIDVTVGESRHSWHVTPSIGGTAGGKPQTAVFEDDYGARLLVDYRILSDLGGKGWGIGWDDEMVLTDGTNS